MVSFSPIEDIIRTTIFGLGFIILWSNSPIFGVAITRRGGGRGCPAGAALRRVALAGELVRDAPVRTRVPTCHPSSFRQARSHPILGRRAPHPATRPQPGGNVHEERPRDRSTRTPAGRPRCPTLPGDARAAGATGATRCCSHGGARREVHLLPRSHGRARSNPP